MFEFAEPTTVNTQILVSNGSENVASAWGEPGINKLECSFTGKDLSKVAQCALQTSAPTVLKVTAIYLVKQGGESGVENIKAQESLNGIRYNLSGQRVSDTYKGVVIQNGRKFIQK